MEVDEKPPWTGGRLAKLGDALVADKPVPDDCPHYSEVMEWHSELCAQVAAIILTYPWKALSSDDFDVAARAKTIDTLRQKLVRQSTMKLNQVQDLAGVRVDADCSLQQQTAFAYEIAIHFGGGEKDVHDLRESPHSGYRAVHVWLRLPAGRVEIQIRTRAQSSWANAYEELGDTVGRHIRYGQTDNDPAVQGTVESLHRVSRSIATLEERHHDAVESKIRLGELEEQLSTVESKPGVDLAEIAKIRRRALRVGEQIATDEASLSKRISELAELMEDFRRTLSESRYEPDGEGDA